MAGRCQESTTEKAAVDSLHIAMFMASLRPGSVSWTLYQDFARALRDRGHRFDLLTYLDEEVEHEEPGTVFLRPGRGMAVWDRLLEPFTRTGRLVRMTEALTRYFRSVPAPDVVYVEQIYPNGAAVALAHRFAGLASALVVTPMGEDILEVPEAEYGFGRFLLPRWLARWTLRRADGIRWISPLARRSLRGARPGVASEVPLSVAHHNLTEGFSEEARAKARDELSERAGTSLGQRPVVLSLGRLHPFKGLHFLVDAMVEVEDALLVVIGPSLEVGGWGDYASHLGERAKRHGIADRVFLTGSVPHEMTPGMLAAADVLVVPSILESLNKVCVESVAVGTPVVVTRTTGISEYLPADAGRVVEPSSSAALAGAIRSVLDGGARVPRESARPFLERFSPDRAVADLEVLFRRALDERPA